MRVYAAAVLEGRTRTDLEAVGGGGAAESSRTPRRRRRATATGPGRARGLAAIIEQGQVVADYWKGKKARKV